MKSGHLVILQLCFVLVACARLSRKQLEQRIQAIQTLTMQDMQIMKEVINNNAEGIKKITEIIQENEEKITSKMDGLSNLIHKTLSTVKTEKKAAARPSDVNSTGLKYDTKTKITQQDIKRLQRAFQDQKMYSMSLQVSTLNQIEKQDVFMKNISTYLSNCDLDEHLKASIEKLDYCVGKNQGGTKQTSSVEFRDILMKADKILMEVVKGRSALIDRLSAITNSNADTETKLASTCFNVVYVKEPEVVDNNKHECLNISAPSGRRKTFQCGNRNIRLGDAQITEVAVEGRVEVRYNNHWGTVCRDSFDRKDANVACKSLGFARGVVEKRVPEGKGQIWLSNLNCNGDEHNLFDCPRYGDDGIGGHTCTHYGDAGVRCFWLP